MSIRVYSSTETVFTHNGLGILTGCIRAPLTEELNGAFEIEIEHAFDFRSKWLNLIEGNIVKADGQLFRIYHKKKTIKSVVVNARHIFFDLLDNTVEALDLTGANGVAAITDLISNEQWASGFTVSGDHNVVGNFSWLRKNIAECILGKDGIIKTVGGELQFDNKVIKIWNSRGSDRQVLIKYGKNIVGIEETLDVDGICTRLMPVGKDGLLLAAKYIDAANIGSFAHPKVRVVEFNDIDNVTDLTAAATAYFATTKCNIPAANYKVDFIELTKTEQYKSYAILESVALGDTVTIRHSVLGVDLQCKVIKTIKNMITDRIEKIELGSFNRNMATNISSQIQDLKGAVDFVKSDYILAVENATAQITGADGGNIKIKYDVNNEPTEILIMNHATEALSDKIWRWNIGGLGFSSNYGSTYTTAITQDGSIVATFITTGSLSSNLIKAGWNGIASTVQIDSTGLAITDGKLVVKNSSNVNALYIDSSGRLATNTYMAVYETPASGGGTMVIPHGIYNIPPTTGSDHFAIESDDWVDILQTDGTTYQSLALNTLSVDGYHIRPSGTAGITEVQGTWSVLSELWVQGDSHIYGTKNRVVKTTAGDVSLNAYETADCYFGDLGSGKIIGGSCTIAIDPIFAETVNTNIEYHVFLQKYGAGDVWISDRQPTHFVVTGSEGLEFAWELKAKQRDYEMDRLKILDEHIFGEDIQTNHFIDNELSLLQEGRETLI